MNKTKLKEILLVDDDADYRELTRVRLASAGYQVAFATGGQQALELLEQGYRPALVILDVNMPDKNGLATMMHINTLVQREGEEAHVHVPVIVATGLQSEKIRELFQVQKVDDYLKKPYSAEDLIKKIRRLIG